MNASRRRRKLAPSRISFVKMSDGLTFPFTWETVIEPSPIHSRVEFSLSSMWRLPLEVMLWHHLTQASLSFQMGVGDAVSWMGYPFVERCSIKFLELIVRRELRLVARISASHELSAVLSWRSAFHMMGPPERKMMAPLMLRNLNNGS